MGFQSQVNIQPAPGVAGDFASANPHASVLAGAGALVAGAAGLTVGMFGWVDSANLTVSNTGVGVPTGFVHREQQALITQFLGQATQLVPAGLPVVLHQAGDFWAVNSGASAATIGQKVYANNATGAITTGATGTPPTSGSCTGGTLAKIVSANTGGALPTTNTCTGSIAGTTLTVTAVGSGSVLGKGQTLSGTNVGAGTSIVAQLTGTAGSTGTYQVSESQTVTSTTITMSGGGLTLTGANASGVFAIGMTISGTNIPTGTTITGYGTGTAGGAGTYTVDRVAATAATASTVTAANAMFLTVDSSSTGVWALSDTLSGSGVVGQAIGATGVQNANLTGLGGAGTYLTNAYQGSALTSQTIGANSGTETKWVVASAGAAGELIKISSWLLG